MPETFNELCSQLSVARCEIKNLRQQLLALKHAHKKDVDHIMAKLQEARLDPSEGGQQEAHPDPRAAAGPQEAPRPEFGGWRSIGEIKTWFPGKRGVPRQAGVCPEAEGAVVLSPGALNNPAYSLQGLEEYSHIWILYHFHQTEGSHTHTKVSPPRLAGKRIGVFASRSPHRPCPIGLSLVKLNRIDENKIFFSGVDMVDGTPVIDIKPYIPQYDAPQGALPAPPEERLVEGGASSPPPPLAPAPEAPLSEATDEDLEREAPDGEEGGVQVAPWVLSAPATALKVSYTERALQELAALSDNANLEASITRLLGQDPRSAHLRRRLGASFYTFRIAALHVTVRFDDAKGAVTVMFVQAAAAVGDALPGNGAVGDA